MIVAAAILRGSLVLSLPRPARHHDIIRSMTGYRIGFDPSLMIQGFLTDEGRFMDREMAATHAVIHGQIIRLGFQPDKLFTEDLW
jgi:hypothetical protein